MKNRRYLHDIERDFILADMAKLGDWPSPTALMNVAPGRYDKRYLNAAMNRLVKERYLIKSPARWASEYHYQLTGRGAEHLESAARAVAA